MTLWRRWSVAGAVVMTAAGLAMAASACAQMAAAQQVAATPPMGWNSWDAYGLTITEAGFRANVGVLKTKLKPFGWKYAVIDEGWFLQNPQDRPTPDKLIYQLDAYGRYVPVPSRFPSAEKPGTGPSVAGAGADQHSVIDARNQGFIALGRWVHAQGLKFGIHIVRGIPREAVARMLPIDTATGAVSYTTADAADKSDVCPWDPTNWGVRDNAAGQAWYDSLMRQYASWGVDLIKVDCISAHPYKLSEIEQIRHAINKTGRPMVLSLSPGPTSLSHADEVVKLANMWRISDDFWDVWSRPVSDTKEFPQTVTRQFGRLAAWEKYAGPGHWPDADMLPLGELKPSPGWGQPRATRFTPDEQHTLLTLWAIGRSPLILGANLRLLDDATLKLLTNRDVLRVNQTATRSWQAMDDGDLIAWRANLPGGEEALAVFNTGDKLLQVDHGFADFDKGLGHREWQVRDAWAGTMLGPRHGVSRTLRPHGCFLLLLH